MNKMQMQVVLNRHEARIKELETREALIFGAIKRCFPNPTCTDGFQLVPNEHYNDLVEITNS